MSISEPQVVGLPRSTSEGRLWAKFRRSTNCINMTHSQTQEQLTQQQSSAVTTPTLPPTSETAASYGR